MDLSETSYPTNTLHHGLPQLHSWQLHPRNCSGHGPSSLSDTPINPSANPALPSKRILNPAFSHHHHCCHSGPRHSHLPFPTFQCILREAATPGPDKMQIKPFLSCARDPLSSMPLIQKKSQSPTRSASSPFFDLVLYLSHPCSAFAWMASFLSVPSFTDTSTWLIPAPPSRLCSPQGVLFSLSYFKFQYSSNTHSLFLSPLFFHGIHHLIR